MKFRLTGLLLLLGLFVVGSPILAQGSKIVHDTKYYILEAQNGERWAADDKAVDEKLAEFRKKNGGNPPNVLYILRTPDLGHELSRHAD